MWPFKRTIEPGYMIRWNLLPRNRWFNIRLHKFIGDDPSPYVHNHPWCFMSILLRGDLYETYISPSGWHITHQIARWWPRFHHADHRHRIALKGTRPAWTIVVTGPKTQGWGFYNRTHLVEITSFDSNYQRHD